MITQTIELENILWTKFLMIIKPNLLVLGYGRQTIVIGEDITQEQFNKIIEILKKEKAEGEKC